MVIMDAIQTVIELIFDKYNASGRGCVWLACQTTQLTSSAPAIINIPNKITIFLIIFNSRLKFGNAILGVTVVESVLAAKATTRRVD
jgi:hypothetical protein